MQPLGPDEPSAIGPYRLLGALGAGGMGRVYLGRSEGGRTVAVKVVHPHVAHDEAFRARFRREVAAARQVGGRWTAPVLDADPDAAVPWVATGFFAGPDLSAAVGEHGPLPGRAVRGLGAGLAQALAAVHALGLVHRDVKPSNVLLTLGGPKLIDFGIARAMDGNSVLTSTGVTVGSPGFMAPEAIQGRDITGAADVFSLGAVLAYAVSGQTPFRGGSTATLLYKVVHEEPELGPMDGELRELVLRCLAKEPGTRPGPEEVAVALAPEGPAALLGSGWLPGPLVEQLSRLAVGLLDLDTADGGGAGPVPPSTPDPRMAYGRTPPLPPRPSVAVSASLGTVTSVPVVEPAAPEPAAPDGAGRRRRVTCSVTLTLALALGVLLLAIGPLRDLLPGGGTNDDAAVEKPQANVSATSSAAPPKGPDRIPEVFLGTWEGGITPQSADPGEPTGTIATVISGAAAVGRNAGTTSQKSPSGELVCRYHLEVQSISATRLVVNASGTEGEWCWSGTQRFTFQLTAGPRGKRLAFSGTGTSVKTEALLERAR
ncbi:serine/threonine-protein kinase [Streptomyces sp. NPDC003691]